MNGNDFGEVEEQFGAETCRRERKMEREENESGHHP